MHKYLYNASKNYANGGKNNANGVKNDGLTRLVWGKKNDYDANYTPLCLSLVHFGYLITEFYITTFYCEALIAILLIFLISIH